MTGSSQQNTTCIGLQLELSWLALNAPKRIIFEGFSWRLTWLDILSNKVVSKALRSSATSDWDSGSPLIIIFHPLFWRSMLSWCTLLYPVSIIGDSSFRFLSDTASIRTFLVGILHKLGHNFFSKFLHYIWELVQHGWVVACRIVPIHASGSTSLFTQTGLNEVAHSGHNQNMTANAFFVDDSPRSVQTEWYQVLHFGFEHEIQLSTTSAPSCCLHDYTIDIFSTVPAVWRVFHLWYLIYLNIHVGKVRLWVS